MRLLTALLMRFAAVCRVGDAGSWGKDDRPVDVAWPPCAAAAAAGGGGAAAATPSAAVAPAAALP
jgi:hypothetical protein